MEGVRVKDKLINKMTTAVVEQKKKPRNNRPGGNARLRVKSPREIATDEAQLKYIISEYKNIKTRKDLEEFTGVSSQTLYTYDKDSRFLAKKKAFMDCFNEDPLRVREIEAAIYKEAKGGNAYSQKMYLELFSPKALDKFRRSGQGMAPGGVHIGTLNVQTNIVKALDDAVLKRIERGLGVVTDGEGTGELVEAGPKQPESAEKGKDTP